MSKPYQFDVSYKPSQFFWPGYPDLERAWNSLAGGPDASSSETGEVWQYMGTWYTQNIHTHEWEWVHQFRHRDHPWTHQRLYTNVRVGPWTQVYLDFQFWTALALANASCAWRLISASLRRSASAWLASSSMILKHVRRMCG